MAKKITIDEFIQKARVIHNDKYDYSNTNYINYRTKLCILCPKHGEFWQTPKKHIIFKQGCPKCGVEHVHNLQKDDLSTFIKKSEKIYGNTYDFSKSIYINSQTKLCIICPKHGEFYIKPNRFLQGHGCPKCKSNFFKESVMKILTKNNIKFEYQKRFKWLGRQSLDFYLPDYNIAIECQGKQHFEPVEYFGGEKAFKIQKERDKRKLKLCYDNNINLIYITYKERNNLLKIMKKMD
jgi:predicted  nucleic acid-binding Zn-ribbon protein